MSGLVSVMYCKAPTMHQYRVDYASVSCLPSSLDTFSVVDIGVLASLQFLMLAQLCSSLVYFCCVRIILFLIGDTSMPKK